MLYLITGGSGSGKSEYAEKTICELCKRAGNGRKIYAATMIPYGEETKQKIARHRKMRAEKAFITKECYTDLNGFAGNLMQDVEVPCFVLLECMSNLIANELFEPAGAGADTVREVIRGIKKLTEVCYDVVVVTNEVCSESAEDTEEMRKYKQVLSEVNCWMAEQAAEAAEVVYGIPVVLKTGADETDREEDGREQKKFTYRRTGMKLIIGGAFQGKKAYAEKQYPDIQWIDGQECEFEEIFSCGGIYHFEKYIRRLLQWEQRTEAVRKMIEQPEQQVEREKQIEPDVLPAERKPEERISTENLPELIGAKNPGIVLLCDEIGYGLVPVDAFERQYRELTGRICTRLAEQAEQVERVVCGIGTRLKGEGKNED